MYCIIYNIVEQINKNKQITEVKWLMSWPENVIRKSLFLQRKKKYHTFFLKVKMETLAHILSTCFKNSCFESSSMQKHEHKYYNVADCVKNTKHKMLLYSIGCFIVTYLNNY